MKLLNARLIFLMTMSSAIAPVNIAETKTSSTSGPFEFRLCFEGNHGRCFEGLKNPDRIRQYGGRTDSEANVPTEILRELAEDVKSNLNAAEDALKSLKSPVARRCTQPLKVQIQTREAIICLDQLEDLEIRSAKKPKVLSSILALIDKLSRYSKPKLMKPKNS